MLALKNLTQAGVRIEGAHITNLEPRKNMWDNDFHRNKNNT